MPPKSSRIVPVSALVNRPSRIVCWSRITPGATREASRPTGPDHPVRAPGKARLKVTCVAPKSNGSPTPLLRHKPFPRHVRPKPRRTFSRPVNHAKYHPALKNAKARTLPKGLRPRTRFGPAASVRRVWPRFVPDRITDLARFCQQRRGSGNRSPPSTPRALHAKEKFLPSSSPNVRARQPTVPGRNR